MIDIQIIDPAALLNFILILPVCFIAGILIADKIIEKDK